MTNEAEKNEGEEGAVRDPIVVGACHSMAMTHLTSIKAGLGRNVGSGKSLSLEMSDPTYFVGNKDKTDEPTPVSADRDRKKAIGILVVGADAIHTRGLVDKLRSKGEVIVVEGCRRDDDIERQLMQSHVKDTSRRGLEGLPVPGRAWQGKGQKRKNKKDRWR